MSDLPIQTVLQQRDARRVSGEHLETLGLKAATDWQMGKFASLHEAVVGTVREERLAPEQVRRVVEFCNQNAYLQEFRKEGSDHRVVHFDCGPADPAQVLQDLNDGGGGSVYDRGQLDYARAPKSISKETSAGLSKTASAAPGGQYSHYEDQLWGLFATGEDKTAQANPLRPLVEHRDKLAGLRDQVLSDLSSAEVDYMDAGLELYQQVKHAALNGTSLGDVVVAWSSVNPDPAFCKVAFSVITPNIRREQVFPSFDAMGESLSKVSSARLAVNPEHPLVTSYGAFCDAFSKLAALREAHADLLAGAAEAEALLKQAAAGGLVGAAQRGLSAAGNAIDAASPTIAKALVGAEGAQTLAPSLSKGLKATGLVGAGLVGNAALQEVTDRPLVNNAVQGALSVVPGTSEYQMRRYRTMTGQ